MGGGLIAGGAATLLVWAGVAVYGAYRLAESRTTMRPGPAIGVVQPDVVYANNIADGFDPDLLRQQLQGLSEQSAREPLAPSLIVWPEAIGPDASLNQEFLEAPYEEARAAAWLGFNSLAQVPPAQRSLLRPRWEEDLTALRKGETDFRRWVADLKVPVLLGAVAMVPRANDAGECWSRFNAALLYTPEAGQAPRKQYKIGLFPLQEAVPWPGTRAHRWLRDWLAQRGTMTPRHWLTPGRERLIFELPDRHGGAGAPPLRYVISFCSESLRPETTASFVTRRDGAKPVDLLINLGNEGGFQRNREQPFHFSLLPFRAVEARVAVAQSVNTGISGFVKPTGEIYGVVTNGRGQYWTGRGAPELPLIANLVRLRRERADEIARDPALARRVNADIARIEALRRAVGIVGQSTQTVYTDSRVTLYSRSGDWFAKLLLALWAAGAVAGTVPGLIRALAQRWRARVR